MTIANEIRAQRKLHRAERRNRPDPQAIKIVEAEKREKLQAALAAECQRRKHAEEMWERASRTAETLAEYLVDAKADLSVAQSEIDAIRDADSCKPTQENTRSRR